MKYVKLRWQPDDVNDEQTVYIHEATDQLIDLLDQAVATTDGDDVLSVRRGSVTPDEEPRPMIFRARRINGYEVVE